MYSPEWRACGGQPVQREVVQQLLDLVRKQVLEALPAQHRNKKGNTSIIEKTTSLPKRS
jgi:hypothetical protein